MANRSKVQAIAEAVTNELPILNRFPSTAGQITVIMRLIDEVTKDAAHVEWLMREILTRFDEWPGPRSVRAIAAQFAPDYVPETPEQKARREAEMEEMIAKERIRRAEYAAKWEKELADMGYTFKGKNGNVQ